MTNAREGHELSTTVQQLPVMACVHSLQVALGVLSVIHWHNMAGGGLGQGLTVLYGCPGAHQGWHHLSNLCLEARGVYMDSQKIQKGVTWSNQWPHIQLLLLHP